MFLILLQVEWIVSSAAKSANTPTRIKMLSNPKERKESPFRHPQWVVGKGARNAQASNRLQVFSFSVLNFMPSTQPLAHVC